VREAVRASPADGHQTRDEPAGRDSRVDDLRRELAAHPCHGCPDREEHARWAERLWQAEREHDRLVAGLQRRSGSIAAAFDRVCAVLDALGYTDGDTVTGDGQRLRSLFGDLDLLAAESIRRGVWDGLTAAELAACVSALTYTARSDDDVVLLPPTAAAREALTRMEDTASALRDLEADHHAQQAREPDLGFARTAYRWTSGRSLAAVLAEAELSGGLSAGDFVRAMRQVIDMLSQVALSADEPVASVARQAVSLARRGVVGYEEPA
jgi:ATP-dependent RNA helicase HelY